MCVALVITHYYPYVVGSWELHHLVIGGVNHPIQVQGGAPQNCIVGGLSVHHDECDIDCQGLPSFTYVYEKGDGPNQVRCI